MFRVSNKHSCRQRNTTRDELARPWETPHNKFCHHS